MKSNLLGRIVLAVVLCVSLIATGCSAQWVSVALADLPVLTQMALNIGAGGNVAIGEAVDAIRGSRDPSAEASKDLTLLQALYNAYKANPSADALQKIESLIQDTNQELPALLQAAHIGDPALSARITAAVNLILTSVSSFASLIPQPPSTAPKTARQSIVIPQPKDLNGSGTSRCAILAGMPPLMPLSTSECCGNHEETHKAEPRNRKSGTSS